MKKQLLFTLMAVMMSFMSFAQVLPILGDKGACLGSSTPLYDTTYGGVWSSSNTAVATVTPGAYPHWTIINGISLGTATITYNVGGVYVTTTFTVTTPPAVNTGTAIVCTGATTTLANATPGGVWTSGRTFIASVGSASGIVTGNFPGTATIYYSVGPGCAALTTVTVDATTAGSLSGDTALCVGASLPSLHNYITGGTWTMANTAIATVDPVTGVINGVSTGTTTITYTIIGSCGPAYATDIIYVNSTTVPGTITGPSSVYATKSTSLAVTGGIWSSSPVWSSSNTAIATVTSGGLVTGISAGTVFISFSAIGCTGPGTATKAFSILPLNSISGKIHFAGPPTFRTIKVYLITFNPSTLNLQAIDSIETSAFGPGPAPYEFLGVASDSIRIKASEDSLIVGATDYIPTYHNSSFYWYGATVFYHTAGTADVNKDINMAFGTIPIGTGFIGGNVTTGANKGTSSVPAVGMRVILVDASGAAVKQTATDASGNYTFTNIPLGTYTIFPEQLNYKTTAYTGINLTGSTSSMTVASFVQHTVSKTITPIPAGIPTVSNSNSAITIFPNPTNGKTTIQWNVAASETGNISVTDVTGRQVYSSVIDMTKGTGVKQIDLSGLADGLYIINVKSATLNYNSKIEVVK